MSNIRLIRNMILNLLERNRIKKRLNMRYPDEILNDISDLFHPYAEDIAWENLPTERELDRFDLEKLMSNKFIDPYENRNAYVTNKDMFPKNYLSEFEQDMERAEKLGVLDEFLKAKQERKFQERLKFLELEELDNLPSWSKTN